MDWNEPPAGFRSALFERIEPQKNMRRVYLVGWHPTLFDEGAVVRLFGRKGQSQHVIFKAYPSLEEAWPFIRSLIRARLRHHYRLIEVRQDKSSSASP